MRFTVEDTGAGIAPQALPRLFHRFEQADASTTRRYGGSGLGLVICKHLVELMGGQIQVDSHPGQGSTFWFELPFDARRIRALPGPPGRLPIVALTAHAMADDRQACLDAGMDGYLSKPIGAERLAQALAQYARRPWPPFAAHAFKR